MINGSKRYVVAYEIKAGALIRSAISWRSVDVVCTNVGKIIIRSPLFRVSYQV